MSAGEAPAVDAATFRALQDTAGADFVAELVAAFREEAPRMLAALRESHAGADAERFRRAAHSLKSNALTFGAAGLAAQARALELGGLAAARGAGDALEALAAEYARVAEALGTLARA